MTYFRTLLIAGVGLVLLSGTNAEAAAKRHGARVSIATYKQSARQHARLPLHRTSHRRGADRSLMTGH